MDFHCISVSVSYDAGDDGPAAGYYTTGGPLANGGGAPALESPRIEITTYGQFPGDDDLDGGGGGGAGMRWMRRRLARYGRQSGASAGGGFSKPPNRRPRNVRL